MNKVILKGRLTKDPEIRYTQTTNKMVASFSIAVNDKYNKEDTDFINCIAWNKTAEFLSKYFNKGKEILITGRIKTRNYENNEGKKIYVTEVIADEVEFIGPNTNKDNMVQDTVEDNNNYEYTTVIGDDELPF